MTNLSKNQRRMLITGATGGMGKACSILAAKEGYSLILADLFEPKLAELSKECSALGAEVEHQVLDVTSSTDIENLIAACRDEGVDAVIHTVGISPTMASWEKMFEVDLIGSVDLLEKLRPHINSGGVVIGITSMSLYLSPQNPALEALLSAPLAPDLMEKLKAPEFEVIHDPGRAYTYAKRALKNYLAANALSWGREGRRLVSIAPGLIDTEMGLQENRANEEGFNAMMSMAAIDRRGHPDDIANTALFLASDKASYICGIDILVDGGIINTFNQTQNDLTQHFKNE